MYFYNLRKISEKEYHVIETRFEGEPEFILAKCSGPVPASDIINAMKLAQSINSNKDLIRACISNIENSLGNFEQAIKPTDNTELNKPLKGKS